MNTTFTIAHLSDVHLALSAAPRLGNLLGKRGLGYLSWRLRRRHKHRREIVEALVHDLAQEAPDHVVITGDLTNLGLPSEFDVGRRWLQALGSPATVTIVPGNHDVYVVEAWERTLGQWRPYMASDGRSSADSQPFPSLRRRGPVALIGLSSAYPCPPFVAIGRVGSAQLSRLAPLLDATAAEGLFRVLLLHHPPVPGVVSWRKRLTDAAALRTVLGAHGVELVLHGHAHRTVVSHLPTPGGPVPVVGAGSASLTARPDGRRSQYNVYRLARRGTGWETRLSIRRHDPASGRFIPEGEPVRLDIPDAAVSS